MSGDSSEVIENFMIVQRIHLVYKRWLARKLIGVYSFFDVRILKKWCKEDTRLE